jgi:hypothetical protein
MSSFLVASSCSRLTSGRGGGDGGAFPHGRPRGACPWPVDVPRMSSTDFSADLVCTICHK